MFLDTNLKHLRTWAKLSQDEASKACDITRTTYINYETGKSKVNVEILNRFAAFFDISLDKLVNHDLRKNGKAKLAPDNGIFTVTVNDEQENCIVLVPEKAAAGYLGGLQQQEYIEQLPFIKIPETYLYQKGRELRAFEISGDSMLPVQPQSVVICERVLPEDLLRMKPGEICVVASQTDGLVLKKVYHKPDKGVLYLVSNNTLYEAYEISLQEVVEVWQAVLYMSKEIPV